MLKSCHQGREGEGGEESLRELVGWDWGGTDGEQRRRYLDQGSHLFHYLPPNLPLLLNCMSSLFIKYHIASNVFCSYISVCDPQLENSWHIMGHTLKENLKKRKDGSSHRNHQMSIVPQLGLKAHIYHHPMIDRSWVGLPQYQASLSACRTGLRSN